MEIKSPTTALNNRQQNFENVPVPSIKYNDFDPEKTDHAILTCKTAYVTKMKGDEFQWKECAEIIKKEFDQKYGTTWHCIVGSHFGSFVSHESKNMIYLFIGHMGVLLFKHG